MLDYIVCEILLLESRGIKGRNLLEHVSATTLSHTVFIFSIVSSCEQSTYQFLHIKLVKPVKLRSLIP